MILFPPVCFLFFSLILSITDLRSRRVPHAVLVPAVVLLLIYRLVFQDEIVPALAAAAMTFLTFLIPWIMMPGKIGGGDLKFAIFLGLVFPGLDWVWPLSVGLIAAFLGILLRALRQGRDTLRTMPVPLVPFLAGGGCLYLILESSFL